MKKILFVSFILMINHTVFSDDNSPVDTWPLPTPTAEAAKILRGFFPAPPPNFFPAYSQVVPGPSQDPEINRLATERWYYRETFNPTPLPMIPAPPGTSLNLMYNFANTNTIPFLLRFNTELMEKNMDENQHKMREILRILLCIESPLAFDAILTILDMADEKHGEDSPIKKQTGKTMREIIIADISEPYEGEDDPPKWKTVVKSDKWHETFQHYQPENPSEKNQAFLEKARAASRAAEEQEVNDETPAP